jgi:hypothetical protein
MQNRIGDLGSAIKNLAPDRSLRREHRGDIGRSGAGLLARIWEGPFPSLV